ncbi:LysR family transcriptional regulator [Litoreibacter janthinus]|uniref:DNA-binding transcriptional regulator, LysR family n=1 Tax=Litoreibacter janthinus TaxID=670154 RepID=A0A1I6FXE1_9RHOB|nr:LysR family transcriptional regulator [Litoreibacter janthinus]SFR34497.1 DNA-binding transcriptional regulator, LysR family [Litoreibacter janthinus]
MRINYDFGDLEAFLAVKETGSFHAAAQRLNLSQSAVTRRVQKLEDALDSQLFERTTRSLKPTLAAKRLQARAEAILEDAQETTRAMRDESVAFSHQRGTVITLATIATVVTPLLTPAIQALSRRGQNPRIRILDGAANEVAEAVVSGEADFGLCSIPMLEPLTEFVPLLDDRIVLAVPKAHSIAKRSTVRLDDLGDTPLILPRRGTGNRLLIDEAIARARTPLSWTYEVGRSTTALELVAQGLGIALVPRSAVSAANVATCTLEAPDIVRSIGMLTRLGQSDAPPVAALKSALRKVASHV